MSTLEGHVTVEQAVVGRDEELAIVAEFLAEARQGSARLALHGPPGIGKTTVWRAGAEMSADQGFQVLTTRPTEAESALAFSGLIDLLDPIAERLLPQLPPIPSKALSAAIRRGTTPVGSADPVSVALGLLGCLRLLAGERPLLIAIDDVQWLDPPSARAVEYAIRRLDKEPIGILFALRSGHKSPIGIDHDGFRERHVGPLGLAALDRLLNARLGVAFLRPTMVRIENASGGNPFVALELGRALLRRGIRFAPERLPIPEDIDALLRERLAGLSESAGDAVLVAALLAHPTVTAVSQVLDHLRDIHRGIDEAVHHNILQRDGDLLTFSHPLLSSVATELADETRRSSMHHLAARVVRDPEERARHLALASPRPSERVAEALESAASAARRRGAPETAADLARLAYLRTPHGRIAERVRRGIAVGHHLIAAGDLEAARAFLDGVLEAKLPGPHRAAVLVGLAAAYRGLDQEARHGFAREAILAAGESMQRVDAEATLADIEWETLGDVRAGLDHARTALQLAERHEDPARIRSALSQVALLEAIVTGTVRHDLLVRSRALQPTERTDPGDLMGLLSGGLILGWAGDLEGSRAWFEDAHAQVIRTGNWIGLPLILRERAVVELRAGRWERAIELARGSEAASEQVGSRLARGMALVGVAQVVAYLGDVDEAREAASASKAPLEAVGSHLNISRCEQLLGFLELSLGNHEAAHRLIGPAIERRLRSGVQNPGLLYGIPDDVEALVSLGRFIEADQALRPFEQMGARLDHRWARAAAGRSRGLILAATGHTYDAMLVLDEALEIHEDVPEPFERARTLLVRGEVERRDRRRAAASRSLRAALDIFDGLGAKLWAARTRNGLRRVDRSKTRAELTETEQRVIALVSAGRTNREVAAELFMSPHTVDSHLRRIYRTVGVRSRAELAGRFPREGVTIHENA